MLMIKYISETKQEKAPINKQKDNIKFDETLNFNIEILKDNNEKKKHEKEEIKEKDTIDKTYRG